MPHAYLIFHLNLAFSSIPAEARPEVIAKCYWPLLALAEETNIPFGIELTGWTLNRIAEIDPQWVERFRNLLRQNRCELIGSGWSQLIGPLVPYRVNVRNQALGLDAYQQILAVTPAIALVNEMAYSTGMVDVYAEAGYQGIIMDRDNVRLALGLDHRPLSATPTHALGCGEVSLPVLWSDSILFQRLQRAVHGDISVTEYLSYVGQRIARQERLLPLYCNDAEIFDYRPGRFAAEPHLHPEGEWRRLERILSSLQDRYALQWVRPSQALAMHVAEGGTSVSRLSSISQPIPVKKQAKYNINRWAVSGRDDLWLNTACHQLYRALLDVGEDSLDDWRTLCELWASDLRTHITESRWQETLARVAALKSRLGIADQERRLMSAALKKPCAAVSVEKDQEGILWTITTPTLRLVLNVRRGLVIQSLAFKSHDFDAVLGTLPQGYFNTIELGADFYSGGILLEIPGQRARLTDLEWVMPEIGQVGSELSISATLFFEYGVLRKTIFIDVDIEKIGMRYEFDGWPRPLGSVRVGKLTLMPRAFDGALTVECVNGGSRREMFVLDRDVDHGRPASMLVSSSSAFGCSEGWLSIHDQAGKGVRLEWEPYGCAPVVMLQHVRAEESYLTRLWFSLAELDDTAKSGGRLLPFQFAIEPTKKD